MRFFRFLSASLLAGCAVLPAMVPAHAAADKGGNASAAQARAMLPEFVTFLKLPNVMFQSSADMRRNADWAEAAFRRHGFTASQLPDHETPMVFAQWGKVDPKKKTVLFYAHMDGQAVFPKQWDTPPWEPTLRRKLPDGRYETLPLEQLTQGAMPDPDWRLFARSSADDKAPIIMLMAAMDALRAGGKSPAINVKIIIDSHEEGGPPTLDEVVKNNAALLKADAVVMLDGPMHASNRPTLVFGHRGGTGFALTVFGAGEELHSGHYGNYAPNPVFALADLLSAMKDADGRVTIPGFYDGVSFDPRTKAVLAAVPDDEAGLRHRLGIAANEKVGENYQEAMNYPTLNVSAMKAGEPDSHRSVIPASATAWFDLRTVPATPGPRELALVRAWVESKGYHLVQGTPTPEERARYPHLAAISGGGGMEALMTPLEAPVGRWAASALRKQSGQEPVRIPIMGGGVPTAPFSHTLGVPVLLIPLVNADDNQHAANENLRMGNYFYGVDALYRLFLEPYAG
ncbi:M20/M25/M40 family metallo-hydrolase [Novosphingobium rosa]|uniref:M20/M25/M40 family metallo-hydrolase n=1 Tax=Novosphingobium rosa TaxID=76978 RepID=UPI000829C45D|nr:M20/M25/M40 family metallo-hydrolase [Novosphingobium rosa]